MAFKKTWKIKLGHAQWPCHVYQFFFKLTAMVRTQTEVCDWISAKTELLCSSFKMKKYCATNTLFSSFVAFSYFPIRMVSLVGVAFFLLGVIFWSYLIFRKFFIGDLTQGWPLLGSILMLGFGLTNISLGIIAEYLWRTLDASRKRPVFIIDEIIKL